MQTEVLPLIAGAAKAVIPESINKRVARIFLQGIEVTIVSGLKGKKRARELLKLTIN